MAAAHRQAFLPAARIRALAEGGYLERAEPVLLVGDPGTGKSHLATGLAIAACRQRRRVRFTTAAELVNQLVSLNPPDHAIVLSVEKSQIQALDRTQPVLPIGLGYMEGVTHDYVRHGTTTLFAALDLASGTVLTECKARHRHQEFLEFLKRIDQAVPEGLGIPLIVDNYATHKHARV